MTSSSAIIVVANRGPASWHLYGADRFRARQASGGLATALVSAAHHLPLRWVAVAGTAIERQVFATDAVRQVRIGVTRIAVRGVPVPDTLYHRYYAECSNAMLWFVQHYLFHPDLSPSFGAKEHTAWKDGYVVVNHLLAEAVGAEIALLPADQRAHPMIMVQDYHCYLVPGFLRERFPQVAMTYFVHIPWPAVRYWQFLPTMIGAGILKGILGSDIIGFQTSLDLRNFVTCIEGMLPEATVTPAPDQTTVTWQGRRILLRVYPISIDPVYITTLAQGAAARRAFAPIAPYFQDRRIILRVDRLDPTKNVIRGLEAFRLLLERHPAWRDTVRFVMVLVPSRESLRRYQHYRREVHQLVQTINAKFGREGDPVVVMVTGNDHARALACMRESAVMLVNSVLDGMHLGAKEFAVTTEQQGILILSRTAGVYQELGEVAAIGITPTDIEETAEALLQAVTMSDAQRARLSGRAREQVTTHTVFDWMHAQLADLQRIVELQQDLPPGGGSSLGTAVMSG